MKESNTRRDRRWWLAQHSAWEMSGQSIVAFCNERRINHQSFYKWRSKFKQESSLKSNAITMQRSFPQEEQPISLGQSLALDHASFVEVEVDSQRRPPSTMTLESPSGWRIWVRSSAGWESLQKAIELLEGLS